MLNDLDFFFKEKYKEYSMFTHIRKCQMKYFIPINGSQEKNAF